ncbi:MAG: phosphoribosylamine--glycine ligase, partial [Alphaproteobacteria bacterium]|nr:phosphoribosylamine--glycine ligase [Alphaproteobacteria bacterium]
ADGTPYRGVLFAGLMIEDGNPALLEFNVRFGDPETQALMLRLRSDLLPALVAAAEGNLSHVDLRWSGEASVCVVMANRGYPGTYDRSGEIAGLDRLPDGVTVFHAGTAAGEGGRVFATGGRVLGVCASGASRAEARALAYRGVDAIDWPGAFCRRDIAQTDA